MVQKLVSMFLGYNFDMFIMLDLMYEIDVMQLVGSCIKNLMYKGVVFDLVGQFIVVINNYCVSGGGNFFGLDGSKMIYVLLDVNCDVLISYIKKIGSVKCVINGLQCSWCFMKLVSLVVQVQFMLVFNKLVSVMVVGIINVMQVVVDDGLGKGFVVYQIDLMQ